MAGEPIRVEGLRDLQRALKKVDENLPKQLKGRLKGIAERVAAIVRPKLPTLTGLLVRKTQARATTKGAGIAWRGVPYAGPTEFGGYPAGREYVASGRYIFPTVDAQRSQIEDELEKVFDEVVREAGLA